MKQQSVRVMLASEHPEMRSFLKNMIESGDQAVIVGQAENAPRALTLARNLRPDVAIIDSYLPHHSGLDSVPLSRIGGLDAAQIISEEIPNMKVVLLNRPEEIMALKDYPRANLSPFFCQEVKDSCVPFAIGELDHPEAFPNSLIFAHIETKASTKEAFQSLSDAAIFLGGCGIVLGLIFILTVFFALPGAFLALIGAALAVVGLSGKLISKIWKKARHTG